MGYRSFGQVISREQKIADFGFRKRATNPHPVFLEVPAGLFNGFPTWVFYTMPEKFEQAPLVLRWCLLFTLIRHESGAFQKRSSNRGNLERLTLRFSVHGNKFENAAIRIQWRHDRDNHVIYLSEVSSNTNEKRSGDCCVNKLLRGSEDGKHLMRFQSETLRFQIFPA